MQGGRKTLSLTKRRINENRYRSDRDDGIDRKGIQPAIMNFIN